MQALEYLTRVADVVAPDCTFSVAHLQIRIIIKPKAKSSLFLRLALRSMNHSSFSIRTHMLDLFVKSLVLNRGFASDN